MFFHGVTNSAISFVLNTFLDKRCNGLLLFLYPGYEAQHALKKKTCKGKGKVKNYKREKENGKKVGKKFKKKEYKGKIH